jgi:hypothetical protein
MQVGMEGELNPTFLIVNSLSAHETIRCTKLGFLLAHGFSSWVLKVILSVLFVLF